MLKKSVIKNKEENYHDDRLYSINPCWFWQPLAFVGEENRLCRGNDGDKDSRRGKRLCRGSNGDNKALNGLFLISKYSFPYICEWIHYYPNIRMCFFYYFSFAHRGAKLQTFCTVKNWKSISSLAITRIVYLTLLLKEAWNIFSLTTTWLIFSLESLWYSLCSILFNN